MARRFGNLGYWHPNWKADQSPLLIKRGVSVDHVVAVTRGGSHEVANFVTACWECNLRKSIGGARWLRR
jgi:5-methylcytosine-specific restriction endonuclease McrA